jgi:hypothetical protein
MTFPPIIPPRLLLVGWSILVLGGGGSGSFSSLVLVNAQIPEQFCTRMTPLVVPFDADPFDCALSVDLTAGNIGNCGNGPIDAKVTTDSVCRERGAECNVGWTQSGESLTYWFSSQYNLVDITFRVSSLIPRTFRVTLDKYTTVTTTDHLIETSLVTPGKGWNAFEDVVWRNVDLTSASGGPNYLGLYFADSMNFCSLRIKPSVLPLGVCTRRILGVPFETGPFNCVASNDLTPGNQGNCGVGPIDAKYTSDSVCRDRGGDCQVGWTQVNESLRYQFDSTDYTGLADITFRVASERLRTFRVSLDPSDSDRLLEASFTTPGKGWNAFEDVVWRNVDFQNAGGTQNFLTLFFASDMNFCSLSIKRSSPPSGVCNKKALLVPFNAGPFDCNIAADLTTGNQGNCGAGPIDAKFTSDSVCRDRGAECFVGWTQMTEFLNYQFSSIGYTGLADITFRVASLIPQTFRVSLDPSNTDDLLGTTLTTPGKGWTVFEDVVWKNVDFKDAGGVNNFLTIFFANDMNYCSLSIKPVGDCRKPSLVVPFDAGPFDCQNTVDLTPGNQGNCGIGPIDAKITTDSVCRARGSECFLGWTQQSEFLDYQFSSENFSGRVDITFRVASATVRNFQVILELDGGQILETYFDTPGRGWTTFQDVVWRNVDFRGAGDLNFLTIFFASDMNYCSLSIKPVTTAT